jgi:sarcosine/dimethylglycine N-methyltransferase
MTHEIRSAIDFYERHPITAEIVLAKLRQSRGHLDGVRPQELLAHDQDHYGGTGATDALARQAQIGPGSRVVDFCAGLGASARYLADRYAAEVTGIELTPARVVGAGTLTRLVGLEHAVRVLEGDVTNVPLASGSCDVVISQEAFLHVPDKARALAEAHRLLLPGGRIAFTDWVAHRPLSPDDSRLMWEGMAATTLQSLESYRDLLDRAGFADIGAGDLTAEWAEILEYRLAMYQKLRTETIAAGTPAGHDAFYLSYVRFVELVTTGALGGGRFWARKA